MQKKTTRLLRSLIAGALLCLATACDVQDFAPPKWDVAVLGPLANTTVTVQDFAEFVSISESFSDKIVASDLGFISGTFPCVPATSGTNFIDLGFTYDSEFESATLGSGSTINYTITNTMPFSISSGFTVEVKSGDEVLFTETVNQVLTANGGSFTPSSPVDLSNKSFTSAITYSITNFGNEEVGGSCLPGADEDVIIDATDGLEFNFAISGNVSSATVSSGYRSETIITDSDINLSGDEIPTDGLTGTISVSFRNSLPVDLFFQVGYPESNYNLFSADQKVAANSTGTFVSNVITKEDYNQIRNSTIIRTTFYMENSSGVAQTINLSDEIEIKFIGDLTVTINSNDE